jgi:hypothetical protein
MNGKPVFMSEKRLKDKTQEAALDFAAQMLQNPLAGNENTFKAEWLSPGTSTRRAHGLHHVRPVKGPTRKSDRTAIAVVGIDQGGNKYLLDGYRHRMTLSERWTALRDLYRRWSACAASSSCASGTSATANRPTRILRRAHEHRGHRVPDGRTELGAPRRTVEEGSRRAARTRLPPRPLLSAGARL